MLLEIRQTRLLYAGKTRLSRVRFTQIHRQIARHGNVGAGIFLPGSRNRAGGKPAPREQVMFFSLDGVDGVGKSTQVALFLQWLRDQGHTVVACRDPGSTALGEAVREILLGRSEMAIHRRSEMLLYMAARAQLVEEVIRPALASGAVVVSDRFLLANVVYQAHAGGLDVADVWRVGGIAVAGVTPDVTFVLDMDVDAAAARLQRSLDRMEAQGLEYLRQVRQGFLSEARLRPEEIRVIDAARDVQTVQAEIRTLAAHYLPPPGERPA